MNETLEWDIRVPLVSNVYVLVDILFVLLLVSGALMAVVLYITDFSDIYGVFRLFLITDGVIIVLLFMVMGVVFTNRFQLLYKLNPDGIHMRVGEFDSSINRVAWRITGVVQRFGISGGRVFSMVNEELFVSWDVVSRVVFDERRRVASLISGRRPVMRVYFTKDNVELVFNTIQGHIPEPEE